MFGGSGGLVRPEENWESYSVQELGPIFVYIMKSREFSRYIV